MYVEQNWEKYTDEEHYRWKRLVLRQMEILKGRACDQFMDGLEELGVMADHIPDFRAVNKILKAKTGWKVVSVKGLIPDPTFFRHLSNREFPVGHFLRTEEQFDYIQEPDIFHDAFGHLPMLVHEGFAYYMEEYGRGGLKALGSGMLRHLARVYWYSTEFGLMKTKKGLRIYGSGIVSSPKESVYALESLRPLRIQFDLMRVMRTEYIIDNLQEVYFVINSIEELMGMTLLPFESLYAKLAKMPKKQKNLAPSTQLKTDDFIRI